ncbi:MAG: hypothetical protein RLZZ65_69 [Bacteroidota bacterium]|jgi:hypothetical protein
MKIKLLLSFLIVGFFSNAQHNETKKIVTIKGNDTTVIVINDRLEKMDSVLNAEMKNIYINDSAIVRVDVFMDTTILRSSTDGSSDSTQIKIGNMKIVILEGKDLKNATGNASKGERKIIIDEKVIIENDENQYAEEWNSKDDCDDCETTGDGNSIWSGLGINANGLMNANKELASASELGFLALDPSKSLGIQFNFAEKRFPIVKEYLGVVTGLGIQWNRYALKGNYDLNVVNDTLVGINTGVNYTKNTLSSAYLQAPLLLQISTNKNPSKAWNISAGVVGGIRIDARQTQKWEADDKKNKDKTKDDFGFNPFQASLMATVGYGDWSLYMTYGLSDVFNEGSAPKVRGVNAGILLSF